MTIQRSLTAAVAVLFLAAPLGAQGASQRAAQNTTLPDVPSVAVTAAAAVPGSAAEPMPSLAPTRADATVGVHESARAPEPVPAPLPMRERTSRNVAMMIVGGAGLIVGAVVGGDSGTIIMIGGGALGLYGLWQYLK